MKVDEAEIRSGLRKLGLQGRDVAVHSSLKSFGFVLGGAKTVIQALQQVCGTVLMPAFSDVGLTNPPPDDHPAKTDGTMRVIASTRIMSPRSIPIRSMKHRQ